MIDFALINFIFNLISYFFGVLFILYKFTSFFTLAFNFFKFCGGFFSKLYYIGEQMKLYFVKKNNYSIIDEHINEKSFSGRIKNWFNKIIGRKNTQSMFIPLFETYDNYNDNYNDNNTHSNVQFKSMYESDIFESDIEIDIESDIESDIKSNIECKPFNVENSELLFHSDFIKNQYRL